MGKYRPIILAAQYGSLNKAASLLGYAQPSMMYIINKMEDDLGVKLFSRTKRGVTLTEAGEKLLPVMIQIEAQEDSIHNIARSFQENRLRIGAFPGMPGRWLSALLAAANGENPDVFIKLETVSSQREGLEALKKGTLHCCFSVLTEAPGMDCDRLREDPYFLVLAADHPLARREGLSLSEVAAALFIMPADDRIGLFRRDFVLLDRALDAEIHIRGNEHAEQARMIAQDIIRTASDKDGGRVLVCEFCDDLALRQENVILRKCLCFDKGGVGASDRNIIQERIGHAFLIFLDELRGITALIGSHVDELAVKNRELQTLGNILGDFSAAAAVFTADGDQHRFHKNPSFLHTKSLFACMLPLL